ncbi:P-loop containing nucleoside triphosphate hydrolase protein [Aspergillus ambiguus]|uniref:putative ABC transporter n=1 Tax=Aspergillus ambiguus TaxID=176160 RepID=UPI003CCD1132
MPRFSLSASAVGVVLAAVLSVPHLRQLAIDRRGNQPEGYEAISEDMEEDEDGEEIISAKAPEAKWQRVTLTVVALAGTLATLPIYVTGAPWKTFQILQVVSWMFLLTQETIVVTSRRSRDRYRLGCYSALTSLFACISTVSGISLPLKYSKLSEPLKSHSVLSTFQLSALIILTLLNLSIPKGPAVYRDGRQVDKHNAVSFLNKYSFMWAQETLSLASRNKRLDMDDLPLIGEEVRAQTLHSRFSNVGADWNLWRKCVHVYRSTLVSQFVIQLLSSGCHFLPQLFLFAVLRQFEARDAGANNQFELWLMAAGLGCSLVIASCLSSLVDWTAEMKLSLPVHEQLFAIITSKIIHLPDIVAPPLDSDSKSVSSSVEDEESEISDEAPRTRHSILNLLGVDVKSISDFASDGHLIVDCTLELCIAVIFLVNLMGWKPTLAGCIIPALLTPVYYYANKKYSKSEEALMEHRDRKSAVLSEAIHGIRQIKFSALETEWYQKILRFRHKELERQRTVFILDLILIALWSFGPVIMSIVSFSTYVYINNTMSASIAFTAFAIFEGVQSTLSILPETVSNLLDASVSARRIDRFLSLPERNDGRITGDAIKFKDAIISWPSDESEYTQGVFRLKCLNLSFPAEELTVITGRSGAGKSLLLQAIIGEADICSGSVSVPAMGSASDRPANGQKWIIRGMMAYVSQDPWIENATVRDSILFGHPFEPNRYGEVLHACALTQDLKLFSDGDMTEVGAHGINLSGGQKWRLALARALYSRASILVLDDIFSAVDSHVGRHLYEHALTGKLCEKRTRIIATHHPRLCLSQMAYRVSLENGRVLSADTPKALVQDRILRDIPNSLKHIGNLGGLSESSKIDLPANRRRRSTSSFDNLECYYSRTNTQNLETGKYYEEEKRETGAVKTDVFKTYMKACGDYLHWGLILLFFSLTLVENLVTPYWVSIWTRAYEKNVPVPSIRLQSDISNIPGTQQGLALDQRLLFYVSVYVGLSLSSWFLEIVRYYLVFRGSLRASKTLFEQFANTILRAPLSFLDTTPAGRILNRFTADFSVIDSNLALNLGWLLHSSVLVLAVIVAAFVSSPLIVGFGVLSVIASWAVASFYVTGAREAKRLESTARSPIFEQVGSLLAGLPTIRATKKENEYLRQIYKLIDTHCQAFWHRQLFNCWMDFWLSMVGAGFVTTVAVMFVSISRLDAPLAGFALSFALDMSGNISWLLAQYTRIELDFNAAERVIEYAGIVPETQTGADVPASWPTRGEIRVNDLHVSYTAHLPPVLKGLTFAVCPGERIGIVGRTGAGKSSLTLALLRFLEAQSGSVFIDGVDVSRMKLHVLRSRVGIIPQDPVVFTGTVREILDPFNHHDDGELHDALRKVTAPVDKGDDDGAQSNSSAKDIFSLSDPIAEGGRNLSQGQRQLLCLARAIVAQPKILIMDEATASIDMESDLRIQRSIREIQGCTLLVIAHRLSTIADFDRILVLENGKVVEFDRPGALMGFENGAFRSLVEQSGDRTTIEAMISATG